MEMPLSKTWPEESRRSRNDPRELVLAKRLVAAYEAERRNMRTAAYRAAHNALAAFVMAHDNWIQVHNLRFVWSKSEWALLRIVVGPTLHRTSPPTKV